MGKEKIEIGDLVQLKYDFSIVSFDNMSLKVWIQTGETVEEIVIPRFISALGQFLPGMNWNIPAGDYQLDDDFAYTGRYYQNDRLYIASQLNEKAMDDFLREFVDQNLEGAIIIGKVVYIYNTFVYSTNPADDETVFYENSTEANHDHYALESYAVIQDMGSNIEFPINIKLLKRV